MRRTRSTHLDRLRQEDLEQFRIDGRSRFRDRGRDLWNRRGRRLLPRLAEAMRLVGEIKDGGRQVRGGARTAVVQHLQGLRRPILKGCIVDQKRILLHAVQGLLEIGPRLMIGGICAQRLGKLRNQIALSGDLLFDAG